MVNLYSKIINLQMSNWLNYARASICELMHDDSQESADPHPKSASSKLLFT